MGRPGWLHVAREVVRCREAFESREGGVLLLLRSPSLRYLYIFRGGA